MFRGHRKGRRQLEQGQESVREAAQGDKSQELPAAPRGACLLVSGRKANAAPAAQRERGTGGLSPTWPRTGSIVLKHKGPNRYKRTTCPRNTSRANSNYSSECPVTGHRGRKPCWVSGRSRSPVLRGASSPPQALPAREPLLK